MYSPICPRSDFTSLFIFINPEQISSVLEKSFPLMLLYLLHSVRKRNSSSTTRLLQGVQSLFSRGSHVCLCTLLTMTMLCSLPPFLCTPTPPRDSTHISAVGRITAFTLRSLYGRT